MKKYVLKDTNEVVDFGDIIELVLIKSNPDGTDKHRVKMVKFSEELIPLLLEEGILDVQDDEDTNEELKKKPLIDFSKDDDTKEDKEDEDSEDSEDSENSEEDAYMKEFMDALVDTLETLGKSVKAVDEEVYSLSKRVKALEEKNCCKKGRCPLTEKEAFADKDDFINHVFTTNKAIKVFLNGFISLADD
jgi:hypothetical protein